MGKDCRSWLYQQHSSWELLNKSNPPDLGPQDGHPVGYPAYACPYISVAKFPSPKFVAPNNSHLRSCQNPQQACSWALQSAIRQGMFSVAPHTEVPNAELTNVKKRFLVFDQTGKETTMFFGSINPPPNPNQIHLKSFQSGPVTRDSLEKLGSREWDQTDISDGEDRNGSMQEDTEELDALLYSDEETEDEEEASTGHSPFEIPQFKKREVADDLNDVAISFPTKRRRLSEDSQDEALTDTASSGNPLTKIWNFEDADESSCNKGSGRRERRERHQALPWDDATTKQVRKEKIQETLGVLSSIIPGGNGKDAAVVLDEAIRYLKSLRLKAKALGVGSLV